ncbi:DUF4326 domain-containing protein [Streptomyces sp. YIM 121038]|uniref:DUF4326 domain-containing protein n=1 Tax=Streptomyces sp. YIM 121038 TaxID=2136401 RepID=UPI001110BEDC|nr:DUF4326 domain-containing protein [Streptomyces sp. YIM 121038]
MPIRRRGSAHATSTLSGSAVYVGRGSRYANPFRAGDPSPTPCRGPMTAEEAVDLFAATLRGPVGRCYAERFARALRGLDLVCTCPLDAPCHADVLLRLASESEQRSTTCSLEGTSG